MTLLNDKTLSQLRAAASSSSDRTLIFCRGCDLKNGCKTPAMKATGEGRKRILFIAEAPGRVEDAKGVQLVGEAGQFLRKMLKSLDVDLDLDARKMNAVNCRPPRNRTPTIKEVRACRPMIEAEMSANPPKVVVLLGDIAVKSYFMDRLSGVDAYSMRGWAIPDLDARAWVVATYHPSFLVRLGGEPSRSATYRVVSREFRTHLKTAIDLLDRPLPNETKETYQNRVVVVEEADLENVLLDVYRKAKAGKENVLAFDYETTGIKPFVDGHDIVYAAFCTNEDLSFAFRFPQDRRLRALWKEVLTNKSIWKVAHNAKYEDLWTRKILGCQVSPWLSDTMLLSHFLDNRGGINSLKFQTAVHFGVFGYEDEMKPFLQPSTHEKRSLSVNNIHKAPPSKAALYCGLDALFTFKLFKLYSKKVSEEFHINIGI